MPSASVPPSAEALHRERSVDPDFWLGVTCWVVIAWCVAQVLLFSFGRDQSIYAVVAEGMRHGQMPYRDVWDFKPPGIYFVYALAQAVLGNTMLSPRLLEAAGIVAMVFGMRGLSRVFFGSRRIGLLGGAIAALIHAQLEFWHTGQPETFGGFITIFALLLTVSDWNRRYRILKWSGVGVLFGMAFLLKPPLGGGAIVCAAYLMRVEARQADGKLRAVWPFLIVGLASLAPIGICALWFRARGAWDELSWTLFQFTPGYTQLGWGGRNAPEMFYWGLEDLFFRFSALAAAGVIAAAVMRPMYSREREGLFLILGVISVHVAGIAMQGKFFQYHYGATLPLVAMLAGLGLYKLWRRCLSGGVGGVLAYFAFVIVAVSMRQAVRDLGSFWERSALRTAYLFGVSSVHSREILDRELYKVADYDLDANRQVAAELARRTAPGEPVFVWGFEPGVYWMAERPAASRFIYDVPQRVAWERERARQGLMQDLEQKPPAAIVVQHGDRFSFVTGDDSDSAEALRSFPELQRLLSEDYAYEASVEDFDIYARKPERAASAE